jgi:hypothetical protein
LSIRWAFKGMVTVGCAASVCWDGQARLAESEANAAWAMLKKEDLVLSPVAKYNVQISVVVQISKGDVATINL